MKSSQRIMTRYGIALVLALSIIFTASPSFAAHTTKIDPPKDMSATPRAYIVVNAKDGAIISQKNMHTSLNVASISKAVTALAAVNTLPADKLIDVPVEAANVQPMRIGMLPGQQWKRDDLLYCLMLVSANDAAYALASASAGSITQFITQQKRIGEQLGMQDSTFGDPSGLDDSLAINGGTKMSAYDVAIAGRAVLTQPQLSQMVSTLNYQFIGGDNLPHTLTNHNDTFLQGYEGGNGIKTGYTEKAGRTIMVSATRNGVTLIAVVLDVQQTDEWAAYLLDEGFADVKAGTISKKAEKLPEIGVVTAKGNVTILHEATKKTATTTQSSSGGFLSVPLVSFIILALLAGLFLWRRRVITHRKKRRRQQREAARTRARREMIDVIDLTVDDDSELISKT